MPKSLTHFAFRDFAKQTVLSLLMNRIVAEIRKQKSCVFIACRHVMLHTFFVISGFREMSTLVNWT
jgi:hypothetical protein